MRFETLQGWLDWQQGLHPKNIELGLERVQQVYRRFQTGRIAGKVITVAGTNGKGSTVAYYETWLKHAGYKVASYTSPHLLLYNERIKLDLATVSDQSLCQAFSVVDEARGDISLTYFEFGTLAALYLISQFQPDVAILEVGLGGRLDAVNIIDADLAHLTPIGLDHQDWLGHTVDLIGREKAGILRPQGMAVCNCPEPPASVVEQLQRLHCDYLMFGRDYQYQRVSHNIVCWSSKKRQLNISVPLTGEHQALNLSGVVAGLEQLGFLEGKDDVALSAGFAAVKCDGRFQKVESAYPFQLYLDVGHNQDAARVLSQTLRDLKPAGRVYLLLGMLDDKNPLTFTAELASVVDEWWLLGLDGDRGMSASRLAQKIDGLAGVTHQFDSAANALRDAVSILKNQDILLVTGSFRTVEAVASIL
ncbi:MAG: bifunctional folylpolyglutamate synthase/dihydrofolate synthase [Gammaproteobacteria bacterium]|nr:bifunctional folylpolyglutamate synthase/dihydrofolate synthase [Gammaproteobacteria bacterium]MBL6998236.1 bifunctional folylpolyglutamate synthase/dihydrofolate synthase [Gammaproteobacteria bacterium]